MKIFCKRTYFEENRNFFRINGKGYGELFVKWVKGQYYDYHIDENWYKQYLIESEVEDFNEFKIYYCLTNKEFDKYFTNIDELRNNKIDEILN